MRNLIFPIVSIAALVGGCAGTPVTDAGDTPLSVLRGDATHTYAYLTPEGARKLDVTTPILKAKESGATKFAPYNGGYTGNLNGAALAIAMRKILADNVLFANAFLTAGPGDCPGCRWYEDRLNTTRRSLQLPSRSYGKYNVSMNDRSFPDAVAPIYEEVEVAVTTRGCKVVPGNSSFRRNVPVSDQKNYFGVNFVCPAPQSISPDVPKSNLDSFNQGTLESHLVGITKPGIGAPVVFIRFIATTDATNEKIINASVTSTCSSSLMSAKNHGIAVAHTDWNACQTDELALVADHGWSSLTTSVLFDDTVLSIIDVSGPSWSGSVPSPIQATDASQIFQ